jgi:hypothetical protein
LKHSSTSFSLKSFSNFDNGEHSNLHEDEIQERPYGKYVKVVSKEIRLEM